MTPVEELDKQAPCWAYTLAKLTVLLFLTVCLALLVYTYYRAEVVFQGEFRDNYLKYYVASLGGALFWWVVLRCGQEVQVKTVLLVGSTVASLYIVEIALVTFGLGNGPDPMAANVEAARATGIEYDRRTKLEVIDDLTAAGTDAVPAVDVRSLAVSGWWQTSGDQTARKLLPLSGVAGKTTVYMNETGKYLVYRSDRHGFNNPDAQWDSPHQDWLLIGDSFVQGAAVQPGEDLSSQIRAQTNQTVLNVGTGGNGPLIELATLSEYGQALRPSTLVWVYFEGNDLLPELAREQTVPLLMRYLQRDFTQNLMDRRAQIDTKLALFIEKEKAKARARLQDRQNAELRAANLGWLRLNAIRKLLALDAVDNSLARLETDDIIDPLFRNILTEARARTEAWGGRMVFVYLPEFERYRNRVDHESFRKRSELIEMVGSLGIPVIDIHQQVFAEHPDPLSLFPLRLGYHYNAEGYEQVARAIVARVAALQ